MPIRAVAFLGVRLVALWLVVTSVVGLSAWALDLPEGLESTWLVTMLSVTALPFATALVIWAFSDRLADAIARDAPVGPLSGLDAASLHTLGVSLLGLWVIVGVLPELAHSSALLVALKFARPPEVPRDQDAEYRLWMYAQVGSARYLSLLVRLAVGLVLFLGPGRIARATRKGLRTFFGPVRPEEPDEVDRTVERRDAADEAREG